MIPESGKSYLVNDADRPVLVLKVDEVHKCFDAIYHDQGFRQIKSAVPFDRLIGVAPAAKVYEGEDFF